MRTELLLLLIIPVIIAYGFYIFIKVKEEQELNRELEIEVRSINEDRVNKAFQNYAMSIVSVEYNNQGKPIITQKGQYRANYINDVNRKLAQYRNDCLTESRFSDDFCEFTHAHYPDAKVKDLEEIIRSFISNREKEIEENFDIFLQHTNYITPKEFFEIRSKQKGDIVGVYIIHNESKDKYYVGQAKRLFFRINQHFTGHGNGDVYADYKYGDDFAIKIVKLSDSSYSDLDLLEKDLIAKYNAYDNGYNKTRGN